MFRLIWIASIHTRDFPHRYMPTNIVLDAIRTRRGLKSGVPAMLLAIPYLAAGNIMTILIGRGAPGWFHLLVLLCIWNAFKFLVMGPVSVVLLVRTGTAERRNRRMLPRSPAPRPDGRENRGLRWRTLWAKSVREGAVMSGVADVGVDEHRARVVLALLAELDDPVTGGLLRRVGGCWDARAARHQYGHSESGPGRCPGVARPPHLTGTIGRPRREAAHG